MSTVSFRTAFADELGVSPSSATRELYEELLAAT